MKAYVLKIFFCAILLPTFILMPQLVSAEKTDWSDKSYNFKNLRRIVLFDLNSQINLSGESTAALYKIQNDYYDKAKKTRCTIITEEQARKMLGVSNRDAIQKNISAIADGWIQCNIKNWNSTYYIVPARTVWESRRMTRTHRRSDGSSWEEVYYVQVPVTYPPHRVDVSNLTASFELYGVNGNAIFVREDDRSREDANAQKDMFGRMCNSFFEDVGKKVK